MYISHVVQACEKAPLEVRVREAEGERIKSWVEGIAAADAGGGRNEDDMIPGESGGEGAVAICWSSWRWVP